MFKDLYDYDHPALYMHLVEPGAIRRARKCVKNLQTDRPLGARRVRRAIKRYLRFADVPRIDSRAAGDSWEMW